MYNANANTDALATPKVSGLQNLNGEMKGWSIMSWKGSSLSLCLLSICGGRDAWKFVLFKLLIVLWEEVRRALVRRIAGSVGNYCHLNLPFLNVGHGCSIPATTPTRGQAGVEPHQANPNYWGHQWNGQDTPSVTRVWVWKIID